MGVHMIKNLKSFCFGLLTVSAVLWGVYGLWDVDLINYLLGPNWFSSSIYVAFGLAGVFFLLNARSIIKGKVN